MAIDVTLMLLQILNMALLVAWIVLAIWALWRLRKEEMSDTAQVIWTVVILLIPSWARSRSSSCAQPVGVTSNE